VCGIFAEYFKHLSKVNKNTNKEKNRLLLFLRKKTILGETDKNPPGQKPSRQK
jgi:hypothetical protein